MGALDHACNTASRTRWASMTPSMVRSPLLARLCISLRQLQQRTSQRQPPPQSWLTWPG